MIRSKTEIINNGELWRFRINVLNGRSDIFNLLDEDVLFVGYFERDGGNIYFVDTYFTKCDRDSVRLDISDDLEGEMGEIVKTNNHLFLLVGKVKISDKEKVIEPLGFFRIL
jgi:hypothetical protein